MIVLFFFYRKSRNSATSRHKANSGLRQHRHFRLIFSGGVIGTAFLIGAVFYVTAPETPPTEPISQFSRRTPSEGPISAYEEAMPPVDPTSEHRDPLWDAHSGFGNSRIREITRKALRGKLPEYANERRPANPAVNSFQALLNRWLESEGDVPDDTERYFNRLVTNYGFRGRKSTVSHYLDEVKKYGSGDFKQVLSLDPSCGQTVMVSWVVTKITLNGRALDVHVFSMQSKWSHKSFVRCDVSEQIEAFLENHVRAFEFFGGIFPRIIYVRLPESVALKLRNPGNPGHALFDKFCAYYHIRPEFSNSPGMREQLSSDDWDLESWKKLIASVSSANSLKELNREILERSAFEGEGDGKGNVKTSMNDLKRKSFVFLLSPNR